MTLNKEQTEYMENLSTIPPESRCWCGWYRLELCPNCDQSTSLADRLRVSCKHRQCRNYPRQRDQEGKITHSVACPESIQKAMNAISPDDWSKLMAIADYGIWSKTFPKLKNMFDETGAPSISFTIQEIVDSLPQNLNDVGKILMKPDGYHKYKPTSAKVIAEKFLALFSPLKPPPGN